MVGLAGQCCDSSILRSQLDEALCRRIVCLRETRAEVCDGLLFPFLWLYLSL